jgi:sporulation protein YlmC with PRC-barrel domain
MLLAQELHFSTSKGIHKGAVMQNSDMWLTSALLHEQVRNRAGEILGRVEDTVIDSETGAIQYAVLSFDRTAGMGNKLFAIPWPSLHISPGRDYILLNVDRETLVRAPGFDRDHWPDFRDPVWRRSIYNYYGAPVATDIAERRAYVERTPPVRPVRHGMSLGAGLVLIVLILVLGWMAYLISTRGWEQTRQNMRSTLQSGAQAAEEKSRDAALMTEVKAALALSKGIPSTRISVEAQNDVVTLRGDVPSEDVRKRAEAVTQEVSGVREVRNELVVNPQNP